MMRFLSLGAAACVACLLLAVAPALSANRYRPEPVDFSVAAPGGASAASASGHGRAVQSRPLRTSKRFNLVGLTWGRGAPAEPTVRVRTRRDGGKWTRWNTISAHAADGPDPGSRDREAVRTSSPDWVGEADWVQYRTSTKLPRLRLRFMNVRGTATRADRARTALRRVANSGVVSLAGLAPSGVAKAAGAQPPIVSRADWGAEDCQPRGSAEYGEVLTAFVHHTVNANDYTRAEAPDMVLAICRFHRNTNGWNDIGYNFVVDRYGTIYEGRAGGITRPVIGAQAQGYNAQSTGIANLGTFTSVQQTPAALSSVAQLIRWKLPLEGVPTAGTTTLVSAGGSENRFPAGRRLTLQRVIGHRDTGATSCPGDSLYAQLPELRRLVGGLQPGGLKTRISGAVVARRSTVSFGSATTFSGSLTAGGAPPPVSVPVQVQAFVGRRWKTVSTVSTDTAGAFAAQVSVKQTRNLRAHFPGQGELREANSKVVALAVKPRLTITRRPKRARTRGRAAVLGTVSPRRTIVYQVLQQRRGKRWKVVGSKAVRTTRKGAFSTFFVPAAEGRYRFYVAVRKDSKFARSASKAYPVTVGR